jgi:hypothetical protein
MTSCAARSIRGSNAPYNLSAIWTKADEGGFRPAMVCPLMTQSGHRCCRSYSVTWALDTAA